MNKKSQNHELDVLQNLFFDDELQIIEKEFEKKIKLIMWLYPQLPRNYSVRYKESMDDSEFSFITVNYLPPIEFYLKLPPGYPSKCPPVFSIYCRWLTKEDTIKLSLKLDKIWSENVKSEIINTWADFLKTKALKYLGYEKELDLTLLYSYHLKHRRSKELESHDKHESTEQGLVNREDQLLSCDIQISGIPVGHDRKTYKDTVYSGLVSLTNKVKKLTNWSAINCSRRPRTKSDTDIDAKVSSYDRRSLYMSNLKTSPVKLLVTYNAERESVEFEKKLDLCVACFCEFSGKDIFKFDNCNHTYCKYCMKNYFAMKINDSMHPIKCPENDCRSTATVNQVKDLVSQELFGKYEEVLVRTALDSTGRVIHCPRPACQYPAIKDKDGKFGICACCQYSFCLLCRMEYHGVEPCKMDDQEKKKLTEKYLNGTDEEKEMLETRYGKTQIVAMVNNTLAETWIAENCKHCPKCNVSIEKSEGCNKMICWKCNTYFCWLCSEELERVNPYSHFSDPNSTCSNKLFFLTPLGDDDEDDEYNSDDEQWRDWDWI